ncbi:MAG: hypothetical protein ACXV8O_05510 [Methylobacter sp.]
MVGLKQAICGLETRQLRNQMVHEYIEDHCVLMNVLNADRHDFVPELIYVANRMLNEIDAWING